MRAFAEEAVIYNCSGFEVISQVPLKDIQQLIKSIDTKKSDPFLAAYLSNECCWPDRVMQFVKQTDDPHVKKTLMDLHSNADTA